MSGYRRIENKPPQHALIEQTPDGLIWLGDGGNMTALTARQLATLRVMLRNATPAPKQVKALRLGPMPDPDPLLDMPPRYFKAAS